MSKLSEVLRLPPFGGTLPCEDVAENLEAFIDGDLDAVEQAAIESHIASCEACAAEHRLTETVRSELRALPELDAPSAVLSRVLREAGADRFQRTDSRPARPAWAGWAVAAAAVAALGAALLMRPTPPPTSVELPNVAVSEPATDPAAVAQATEEARYALAYLFQASRRTGLELRDDLLIERVARPTARGLSRSLRLHLPLAHMTSDPPTEPENDLAAIDSDRS